MKVFTLKLSKWLRAGTKNYDRAGGSMLYHQRTRTYCCLGMFGRQCGISTAAMSDFATPDEIQPEKRRGDFAKLVSKRRHTDSRIAKRAMVINDDETTTDAEKIAALRPIFEKLGYRIEVVK